MENISPGTRSLPRSTTRNRGCGLFHPGRIRVAFFSLVYANLTDRQCRRVTVATDIDVIEKT